MKVLIVEDETTVAQNLCDLLHEINPAINILIVLDNIKESIHWINNNESPNLAFFDIKIADGNSFEIFEKTKVNFPIIFTTAYNEYALKAFKYNGIDYLLKPINKNALQKAINKYKSLYVSDEVIINNNTKLLEVIKELKQKNKAIYKKTFLVNYKKQLIPIATQDIAYFNLQNENVYCITDSGLTYRIDQTLEKIEKQLDPIAFFRANRQNIVSKKSIKSIIKDENRKLKLIVNPESQSVIIVSKLKATKLKKWLDKS
ncbi:LytTR family DNA-binding domain-containing protein [Aquimarina sp. 2201CG5-10]|uniref:LytR/AlgR family response regulator transcription factor n=1 Tax=Aquimarina callyspongiae TaxID=3098150 RepID=UPI002AB40CBA|nr:LytTR family DNA-binding domain-containing protein [Aquimarina sp. 2201CG5-10]MDY8135947.1 LytTR family DNA-binding domain-containing protein [Aquimarina sp. 2201CG5-10]